MDPDPALFVSDLQDVSKKIIIFLLLLFEAAFASFLRFFLLFCLMMEVSESESVPVPVPVPLTKGSGRPKNLRIQRILITYFLQCCGSGMFIPDPGSDFFPSRIPDPNCLHPGSSSKNLSILTPKKAKKWFPSSKKI